jgi:D-alanyl-D-alanine carboxypeptidase
MQKIYAFCALALSFLLVMPFVSADAWAGRPGRVQPYGVNDPRYAALVMDPQTGEVFHARNADAMRRPASLTKMMTLYLLFEELKAKRITMGTRMRVSPYAARQPQTNISLRPGEMIPVETAIKALVVRSANDVAVVVAEHIGKSEAQFAQLATRRAKELGMQGTIFKNPHGLPNPQQVTTARDMAKLGIALRRDFPDYYRYFAVRQFSWKGVTYYTHNRVMTRYSGTDGIKTGFINASGFNVVSSVQRGGRRLIGVVLGGSSGVWRDDQMIALLGNGYQTLAARGNRPSSRIFASNLPKPRADTVALAAANAKPVAPKPPTHSTLIPPEQTTIAEANLAPETAIASAPVAPPVVAKPAPAIISTKPALPATVPFGRASAPLAATAPLPIVNQPDKASMENSWGIQVGAFADKNQAERAVAQAYQLAESSLQGYKAAVIGAGATGTTIHRARIENLSEIQAKKACQVLISNNAPCFIYRAPGQRM